MLLFFCIGVKGYKWENVTARVLFYVKGLFDQMVSSKLFFEIFFLNLSVR